MINSYLISMLFIFFMLLLGFLLNSLIVFFICYECLIILLFFILFIFIPSFYRIRTALFSFLFSILGSINFILSLFYLVSSISLFSLLLILPFLIKIPTFPFYYLLLLWLLITNYLFGIYYLINIIIVIIHHCLVI